MKEKIYKAIWDKSRSALAGTVYEDGEIVLASNFECGNGYNFRKVGPDRYFIEIEPEPGEHSFSNQGYYFCVAVLNKLDRRRSVTIELKGGREIFADGEPDDHVMWNNKTNGTSGTASRDFAEPLAAGTLTYELRPNDNDNGNYISWVLIRDPAKTSYMAQVIARYNTDHSTYEFYMFVPGIAAESSGNDGVSLAFTPETVFEVKIDFDFSDTGGGARPNGTFDLQVTRLNDSTVVWTQSDIQSYQPLGNIGNLLENGGNQNAGFATWYDNINLVPEPCTLTMLAIGAGALLKRRRA